jgi:flagellar basal body P-ring protein FlgI
MPKKMLPMIFPSIASAVVLFAWILLPGCDNQNPHPWQFKNPTTQRSPSAASPKAPLWRAGTVSEVATLEGGMNIRVGGYGLVVGLGKGGSDTTGVPPQVVAYLKEYLLKKGMSSPGHGTEKVPPEMILRDPDTAVVLVVATVPALAPVGTRYDLTVRAIPQSQTSSLEGGYLMGIELFLAPGGMMAPVGGSQILAQAQGQMFINPFLDTKKPGDLPRFREGRILNGGMVVKSAPIRLVLRRADYGLSRMIQGRVNERFPSHQEKVANAISAQMVELTIPEEYRDDYIHFLNLVLHTPLTAGAGVWESKAKEIALAMDAPGANYEELSSVLEAMGKTVLPMIKTLYSSSNAAAAYYAARTGLRLGDIGAMEVVIHYARDSRSPLRLEAIEEVGRNPGVFRGNQDLQELLNDPSEPARVAAYEALIRRNDQETIHRTNLGHFCLDTVQCKQSTIYATQGGVAKVVLMGQDIGMQKEIYFTSTNGEIIVNSDEHSSGVTVMRRLPTGKYTPPLLVPRDVSALVRLLGTKPPADDKSEHRGLGLSYSQIVGVLHGMCKQHDIDANFVLQQTPDMKKMNTIAPSTVRPDLPDNNNEESAPEPPKK